MVSSPLLDLGRGHSRRRSRVQHRSAPHRRSRSLSNEEVPQKPPHGGSATTGQGFRASSVKRIRCAARPSQDGKTEVRTRTSVVPGDVNVTSTTRSHDVGDFWSPEHPTQSGLRTRRHRLHASVPPGIGHASAVCFSLLGGAGRRKKSMSMLSAAVDHGHRRNGLKKHLLDCSMVLSQPSITVAVTPIYAGQCEQGMHDAGEPGRTARLS